MCLVFIATHSKDSMLMSIYEILHISQYELDDVLTSIGRTASDDDDYIKKLDSFINESVIVYPDEILMFHLSRRLHGTEDDVTGRNLADLLTTENAFSNLMKKAGIEFVKGEQHINVLYNGEIVDWDKCWRGNSSYMKVRLGYYKGREDYCFNGFAFKDLLYKNSYFRELYRMPEFLGQLIECLDCKKVGNYYMEHSDFFCYEYKLPLEIVMFDEHEKFSLSQKQHYLIRCVLQRLAQYQTSNLQYNYDHSNPILRLADDFTVPAEYYVNKEKISYNMLK